VYRSQPAFWAFHVAGADVKPWKFRKRKPELHLVKAPLRCPKCNAEAVAVRSRRTTIVVKNDENVLIEGKWEHQGVVCTGKCGVVLRSFIQQELFSNG
jgi:hypothetical protein